MRFKKGHIPWNKGKNIPIIKSGDKFGMLTAVSFSSRDKLGNQCWLFRCDCGTEKIIKATRVKGGHSKSCGCYQRD